MLKINKYYFIYNCFLFFFIAWHKFFYKKLIFFKLKVFFELRTKSSPEQRTKISKQWENDFSIIDEQATKRCEFFFDFFFVSICRCIIMKKICSRYGGKQYSLICFSFNLPNSYIFYFLFQYFQILLLFQVKV